MAEDSVHLSPDAQFLEGCTLLRACAEDDVSRVRSMLEKHPALATFKDYDSRTALHVAASEGCLELVRVLLNAGAGASRSDRWGGSPLDDAMRHRHAATAALLRQSGGRLGAGDRSDSLLASAARGEVAEVRELLGDGVDPCCADYDARTPLHVAASEGHDATYASRVSNWQSLVHTR